MYAVTYLCAGIFSGIFPPTPQRRFITRWFDDFSLSDQLVVCRARDHVLDVVAPRKLSGDSG